MCEPLFRCFTCTWNAIIFVFVWVFVLVHGPSMAYLGKLNNLQAFHQLHKISIYWYGNSSFFLNYIIMARNMCLLLKIWPWLVNNSVRVFLHTYFSTLYMPNKWNYRRFQVCYFCHQNFMVAQPIHFTLWRTTNCTLVQDVTFHIMEHRL